MMSSSSCPGGFVIPDDINSPDNWYIDKNISNCAVACRYPNYTPQEWKAFETVERVSIYTGICLVSLMIFVHVIDRQKRTQYLAILLGCLSLAQSMTGAVMHTMSFEERSCRNNAVLLSASDGLTFCAVQSVVQVYAGISISICWLVQAVLVFKRIVLEQKEPVGRRLNFAIALILGLPILSCVVLVATGSYGITRLDTSCVFGSGATLVSAGFIVFGPIGVILTLGSGLLVIVLWKVISILSLLRQRITRATVLSMDTVVCNNNFLATVTNAPTGVRHGPPISHRLSTPLARISEGDDSDNSDGKGDDEDAGAETDSNSDGLSLQQVRQKPKEFELALSSFLPTHSPQNSVSVCEKDKNKHIDNGSNKSPTPGSRLATVTASESVTAALAKGSMRPLLWLVTTPVLFLVGYSVVFASITVENVMNVAYADIWRRSFQKWAQCALDNYNGQDSSWHAVCGYHPVLRMSPALRMFFNIILTGQSSFIATIYSRPIWVFLVQQYQLVIGYRPLVDVVAAPTEESV